MKLKAGDIGEVADLTGTQVLIRILGVHPVMSEYTLERMADGKIANWDAAYIEVNWSRVSARPGPPKGLSSPSEPAISHDNCEVVKNTAGGKEFLYCRDHKVEVTRVKSAAEANYSPETLQDIGRLSNGQTIAVKTGGTGQASSPPPTGMLRSCQSQAGCLNPHIACIQCSHFRH